MENLDRELIEAVQKAGGSSVLINILAIRIRQIHRGAKPLLESVEGMGVMEIAIREFIQGKIGYRRRVTD
ncbi:MAG: DNA-directed RNA polymerase subunit omega [Candidatus Aureabacteria bacterium]|nr:DNA-directed RNA polymerase subunit omega [Candidatus Auribacterota bacterium]